MPMTTLWLGHLTIETLSPLPHQILKPLTTTGYTQSLIVEEIPRRLSVWSFAKCCRQRLSSNTASLRHYIWPNSQEPRRSKQGHIRRQQHTTDAAESNTLLIGLVDTIHTMLCMLQFLEIAGHSPLKTLTNTRWGRLKSNWISNMIPEYLPSSTIPLIV